MIQVLHHRRLTFVYFLLVPLSIFLSACGGSGSGSSGSATLILGQPSNLEVSYLTNSTVVLNWDGGSNTVYYEICQAEESITDATSCLTYSGGVLYQDIDENNFTVTDLSNGTEYYFVVTAIGSDDNDGTSSAEMSFTPIRVLNDTGITTCSDYAISNSGNDDGYLDCSDSVDSEGDPIPSGQDATFGRDVDYEDDSDGKSGFSFTKLDSLGDGLDASASSWSCIKDNVTGLVWESKTDDSGLHDKDHTFTWYNTDITTNAGDEGSNGSTHTNCYGYDSTDSDTFCNTEAFVARVNEAELCGIDNWRLPHIKELVNLVDFGAEDPAIDTNYFPNTEEGDDVWSFSTDPSSTVSSYDEAYYLHFNTGKLYASPKSFSYLVRLVADQ